MKGVAFPSKPVAVFNALKMVAFNLKETLRRGTENKGKCTKLYRLKNYFYVKIEILGLITHIWNNQPGNKSTECF